MHGARNDGGERVVLIVDFLRPEGMEMGKAGGESGEVEGWREEFIKGKVYD